MDDAFNLSSEVTEKKSFYSHMRNDLKKKNPSQLGSILDNLGHVSLKDACILLKQSIQKTKIHS